ncbi:MULTISPECIES: MATE family efflux transporter [unclassified Paenibacillus]|uniref:MATE family efflux transporter n=1 Tax=unclassified Paenibacillus TaxID=185978 RepID=UPI0024065C3A|nr:MULTISPECIES: MATE family efflux transporter [unclassified Paenibacillus]MDF9842688.1 MATE family multidrug resistance protein [Paenibacillus sp. PastF-2]MDF9849105.1 MATE family multidrug resistance protein [Paenibacillus sp. PastM-2]MDF9855849.1 MATE family multidrug resistance protein [Paenibacillus sp. PastF-1]MDH6480947.1 MATE family multidrug resistance protein [Paenibacillus sp. PastH-2]MDH6508540.1 MATE family multidrug resistance protein [Paenibacillus sp. PastM-3]
MNQTHSLRQKTGQFLHILFPILITQIALSAITFFDTNMSGKYGTDDLAGVAIGTSLWIPIQTGLSGILMGITPIVSHLIGSRKNKDVAYQVTQGIWLSLLISLLVLAAGSLVLSPVLNFMNLEPQVRDIAFRFLCAISVGIIPLFGYTVLRSTIDALGQTRVSMLITLIALPVNVGLNYLLIFGKFGFPEMGGVGAGVASAITYWVIFAVALHFIYRFEPFKGLQLFRKFYGLSLKSFKELLKIGVPIGFSIFFETAVFSAVTLLMSRFDTVTIAAHQAAINFASTLYMIPLSICMSLTILVGFESGSGRLKDARQYSIMGIGSAAVLSLLTALVLLFAGNHVAGLYSDESEVIALIQHFLIYAIFFQISDAIATPTQGVLRGYKDVNPAFIICFIAYWVIGLPTGYLLATYTDMGAYGYWIGLITGLAIGAILLLGRLVKVQRNFSARTVEQNNG